mgnify:CR=1 FL=1
MKQKLSVDSIPITNGSSAEILVALEPEGETHALAPGQVCRITARPDLGAAQDLEFEIEIGDGVVSVFLVCEKEVTIAESG